VQPLATRAPTPTNKPAITTTGSDQSALSARGCAARPDGTSAPASTSPARNARRKSRSCSPRRSPAQIPAMPAILPKVSQTSVAAAPIRAPPAIANNQLASMFSSSSEAQGRGAFEDLRVDDAGASDLDAGQ